MVPKSHCRPSARGLIKFSAQISSGEMKTTRKEMTKTRPMTLVILGCIYKYNLIPEEQRNSEKSKKDCLIWNNWKVNFLKYKYINIFLLHKPTKNQGSKNHHEVSVLGAGTVSTSQFRPEMNIPNKELVMWHLTYQPQISKYLNIHLLSHLTALPPLFLPTVSFLFFALLEKFIASLKIHLLCRVSWKYFSKSDLFFLCAHMDLGPYLNYSTKSCTIK